MDGTVKIIEEVAPILKNSVLVLVLRQLVINVIEPNGFGIIFILHPAYPILRHLPIGNRLLRRNLFLLCFFLLYTIRMDICPCFSCDRFLSCRCRIRFLLRNCLFLLGFLPCRLLLRRFLCFTGGFQCGFSVCFFLDLP